MSSQPSFSSSLLSELASASWHWCRLVKQPDLGDGTNYCEHTSRAVFKMPSSPSTLMLLEMASLIYEICRVTSKRLHRAAHPGEMIPTSSQLPREPTACMSCNVTYTPALKHNVKYLPSKTLDSEKLLCFPFCFVLGSL